MNSTPPNTETDQVGLMEQHYNAPRHYLAVDCIIFGFDGEHLKLLLVKRDFEPHFGEWSLMGGFLRNDESLDHAAERVLERLTGLRNIYLEQLYVYSDPKRDEAARVVSTAYFALINTDLFDEVYNESYKAQWYTIEQMPDMILDHGQMVDKALKRLSRRCKTQPVGFELMPDKFTIPQLQRLYEAIFRTDLDKRNFRRKMLSMDLLVKLEEKDKENSKRGAFFYQFDKDKYDRFVGEGFHFEVLSK